MSCWPRRQWDTEKVAAFSGERIGDLIGSPGMTESATVGRATGDSLTKRKFMHA